MKVLRYIIPNQAEIAEVAKPKIGANQALAKSIVTNVSAGTEMAFYKGTAPQINSNIRADGLWEDAPNNVTYPMQSSDPGVWWMGYACVAKVEEIGSEVRNLQVGDIIFTPQGHKEYQVIEDNYYKLPANIKPEHASFITLTEITFNGILDSKIKLMDNILIIGMGTLGQLLLQMCKLSGAYVIAVDYIDNRLNLASKLGADVTVNSKKEGDLGERVISILGSGADTVIEVTGNSKALPDAVRCVRKEGQVTVLSFYQNPPDTFNMGREFHHNRVTIRSSQIGGIDPAISCQYDRARRAESAIKLLQKMNIDALISHRCKFEDYPEMLKTMANNPSNCQSVIIEY